MVELAYIYWLFPFNLGIILNQANIEMTPNFKVKQFHPDATPSGLSMHYC